MTIEERRIEYKDSEGTVLEGLLCYPRGANETCSSKQLPAVTIHHAFAGITEFEEEKTRALAELGYVAFAADVYGKGVKGNTREECFVLLKSMVAVRRGKLKDRLLAGIKVVKDLPFVNGEKVASIGYCFGGLCCLDLARYNAPVKGVISYHGTLSPLESLEHLPEEEKGPIKPSVTVCHGDADFHIPFQQTVDFMNEFRNRSADFQFIHYANAQHAFTEPKYTTSDVPGVLYNEKADKRSWSTTIAFLNELFYSNIFSVLCLLGLWLAFTYSGNVGVTGESGGYIVAGLLFILQTAFYTAPALMLYPKIKESDLRYTPNNFYENDNNIPYQGNSTPRVV
ncbi:hypothetical protein FO519_002252 [Halicephalobus sp. NKZ332]|nr:hypothetical protein FO519_002252 [Halicephalobus sp. NKZ332]